MQPITVDRDRPRCLGSRAPRARITLSCLFFKHRSRVDDPLLVPAVVEGSDQEQGADGCGQAGHACGERAFQQFGQGQRCIRRRVEAGCDRRGTLDLAPRGYRAPNGEDPAAEARRQAWSAEASSSAADEASSTRFELELRQGRPARSTERTQLTDGEQHNDRLELQPPGDEHQHGACGDIQQLSVVDDQQERCGRRHLR